MGENGPDLEGILCSIAWDFPCEQIQNPDEVGKYLQENCNGDSKEKKLIAISWVLTYAHCMLQDTVRQQIEAGGQGDKSAATPVTQAAAKPDNEPKPAAKPDCEPKPMAVAPTMEKSTKAKPITQ